MAATLKFPFSTVLK
ncbi:uncharacterized protein FFM5_08052 [Fusarium fujikuroi]|nr:uncharacterized protein FFM5_08052 [Fusarium fujikuroi]